MYEWVGKDNAYTIHASFKPVEFGIPECQEKCYQKAEDGKEGI